MKPYTREIKDHYSPEERVNVFVAAALTGMAAGTLNKMRYTGGGPVFEKAGKKKVVYKIAEIQRWIRQRNL